MTPEPGKYYWCAGNVLWKYIGFNPNYAHTYAHLGVVVHCDDSQDYWIAAVSKRFKTGRFIDPRDSFEEEHFPDGKRCYYFPETQIHREASPEEIMRAIL